jgi:glutamine amidotransferase
MCRHLAYVGVPRPVRELVTDPEFGLVRQAYAPRRQRHGLLNADGFGVGWYADGDPVPARYRRAVPIWTDAGLPDLARVVRTGALLAAVRDGTPGFPYTEQACAPFAAGHVLFSHNGALPGGAPALAALAAQLDPAELLALDTPTDSAVLLALVRRHLTAGDDLAKAITTVAAPTAAAPVGSAPVESAPVESAPVESAPVESAPVESAPVGSAPAEAALVEVASTGARGGWRNLLATDGDTIVAAKDGDSLCWRPLDGGVVVASEPYDDEPGWQDVPDRHLLVATRDGVKVTPLDTPDR